MADRLGPGPVSVLVPLVLPMHLSYILCYHFAQEPVGHQPARKADIGVA